MQDIDRLFKEYYRPSDEDILFTMETNPPCANEIFRAGRARYSMVEDPDLKISNTTNTCVYLFRFNWKEPPVQWGDIMVSSFNLTARVLRLADLTSCPTV